MSIMCRVVSHGDSQAWHQLRQHDLACVIRGNLNSSRPQANFKSAVRRLVGAAAVNSDLPRWP